MLLRTRGSLAALQAQGSPTTIISTIWRRRASMIGQHAGCLVRHRPHHRLGGFDKAGDHPGVDRIGLGPLAQCLGIGSHLRRVDHDQRQACARQAGRYDRSRSRRSPRPPQRRLMPCQPATQFGKPIRVAAGRPRFSGWQDMHVQPILRHIDANARWCVPWRPFLAQTSSRTRPWRLFGFTGTTEGRPC